MSVKHNFTLAFLIIFGIVTIFLFGQKLAKQSRHPGTEENPLAGISRPQIYPESQFEGSGDKAVIYEFASFTCPDCKAAQDTIEKIYARYGDRILHVWKDFPEGDEGKRAAAAARCAGGQGKFWPYHDWLFDQETLSESAYSEGARFLQLDQEKFRSCLLDSDIAKLAERDLLEGITLGIDTAPTVVVGDRALVGEIGEVELEGLILDELKVIN